MSNYIFLTKAYNEAETIYYAIPDDKIETLKLFETYDGHGQLVGHCHAGDYHFGNSESNAVRDCEKAIAENFDICLGNINIISVGDVDFIIEPGDGEEHGFNEAAVNEFIKAWRGNNESLTAVGGFTYWDGHKFKTIITRHDNNEPPHNVVDDEALTSELNEAIASKTFEIAGFGCEIYLHDKWVVIDTHWQGDWASYELMSVEDYEFRQKNCSALPAIAH
jgi:hypothetical protein